MREKGKLAGRDSKTCERDDRHRARQLGDAGGATGVHARRLLDEALCRQEVHIATSPGSLLQCLTADREVVVGSAGTALRVEMGDAAVVERDLVTVTVHDRIE